MVDEHTPEQPAAEGTTEPEPVQEQTSEPEPAAEPVPVPEPGAVPVTDDEVTEPEPEAATGEPEPTPEAEPEPLAVPEPGAVPASEAEVAEETPSDPDPEAAPEQPEAAASPATTTPRPQPTPPRPTTSLTRELILPAVRLDVPDRPSADQVAALATRGPDDWTTSARDRVTQQVVRLAVAQVLTARVTRPGPGSVQGGAEGAPGRAPLSTDPAEVTVRQAAGLFRPHVDLAAQAFRLAVVEAVNAGVPAATDPVREGLRRLGVTGREPLRMVALGLDRVPSRGRQAFWAGLADSGTVTAFVADLAATGGGKNRSNDVSGLDRSLLARADALVLAGGRTTPVVLGGRPVEAGGWLQVPFVVGRRRAGAAGQGGQGGQGGGGRSSVEVGLRGAGWVEVVDATLSAVSAAMTEIDLGSRPKALRLQGLPEAVAGRLVAAADRTVADVCASLRDVDPDVLELFDARVTTAGVPAVVPVPEEERLAQLWLPGSALAAPLFTAAVDLYLGEGSEVRATGGRPDGGRSDRGRPDGSRPGGRPGGGRGSDGSGSRRPRPADTPGAESEQTDRPQQPGQPGEPGSRGGRPRRGGRGRRRTEGTQPDTGGGTTPSPGDATTTPPGAPSTTPLSAPSEPSSAPQPGGESSS